MLADFFYYLFMIIHEPRHGLTMGLRSIVLIKLILPESSEVLLGTKLRDLGNLILCQLKLGKFRQVALKSLNLVACSESNDVLVNNPSKTDLGLCHAVLLSQFCVKRVDRTALGCYNGSEWGVRRHGNVVLLVKIKKIAMLKVRVVLDLVDSRLDFGCLENGLKVHLQEVGNSNGLGLSRFLDPFQLRPALLKVLVSLSKPGAVDQVEIDVVKAKLLEGNVEGYYIYGD